MTGALGHLKENQVGVVNYGFLLTVERHDSFDYSIPTKYSHYAALYAAETVNAINFIHLTANIPYLSYILFILASVCFVLLLALLQHVIPIFAPNFSWFKTIIEMVPCFRNQTGGLAHANSATRVAVHHISNGELLVFNRLYLVTHRNLTNDFIK